MPAGDRPRRSTRTVSKVESETKSESTKKSSSSRKVKEEKTEDNDEFDDLIDSDDESSEGGNNEISKPWLNKKRSLDEANISIKKHSSEVPLGIPKKKKEEDNDDSGNIKVESTTSLISNIPRPTEQSLIANMKPVQTKHQALTAWKSKEEYQTFKSGKANIKPPLNINPTLPQQRELSTMTAVTSVQPASPVREHSALSERTRQSVMESKIQNDLSCLIPYVIDSKPMNERDKRDSSNLLEVPDERIHKSDHSSKHGAIDWNGSFLPQTKEDRLDFFIEGEEDTVRREVSKSGGQKKLPLSWWGIIEPPREILDMHENLPKEYYRRDKRSGSKRSDRYDQRDEKHGTVIHDQGSGHGAPVQHRGSTNRVDTYPSHYHRHAAQTSDRHGSGRSSGFAPPTHTSLRSGPSREGRPPRNYNDGVGEFPLHQDRGFLERGFPPDRYENNRAGHYRRG